MELINRFMGFLNSLDPMTKLILMVVMLLGIIILFATRQRS